jgi:hypothetical protein
LKNRSAEIFRASVLFYKIAHPYLIIYVAISELI